MKKWNLLLLAALFTFGLSACNKDDNDSDRGYGYGSGYGGYGPTDRYGLTPDQRFYHGNFGNTWYNGYNVYSRYYFDNLGRCIDRQTGLQAGAQYCQYSFNYNTNYWTGYWSGNLLHGYNYFNNYLGYTGFPVYYADFGYYNYVNLPYANFHLNWGYYPQWYSGYSNQVILGCRVGVTTSCHCVNAWGGNLGYCAQ